MTIFPRTAPPEAPQTTLYFRLADRLDLRTDHLTAILCALVAVGALLVSIYWMPGRILFPVLAGAAPLLGAYVYILRARLAEHHATFATVLPEYGRLLVELDRTKTELATLQAQNRVAA